MVDDSRLAAASLTAAVRNSARRLAISADDLQRILQMGPRDTEHLLNGTYVLSQEAPEWKAALQFVRFTYSLFELIGDEHKARRWLFGVNTALGAIPAQLLTGGSLNRVLEYVEQARHGP